jgi:hypothetical protein
MKWWNFDTVYANGSSLTAGGGLDDNFNKREYKKLYDVDTSDVKKITYPKYIADYFNCDLIFDAQSGSGAPRLVRRTHEHIENVGIEKARNTLFLFELTDPVHRVDYYCKEIDDYVRVNVRYDNNDIENISSIQVHKTVTDDGIVYDEDFFKGDLKDKIDTYIRKYHNPVTYTRKFIGEVAGLFSFLKLNNIEFFFMFDTTTLTASFKDFYLEFKDRELRFDEYNSINQFCTFQKLTIKDELNDFTSDTHPGYFGNKKFGERCIKFIVDKLKPRLFVFGDSHTQSFKRHIIAGSEWAVKYCDYINEVPDNFPDIISKEMDIELFNFGRGGCSNYFIFDAFLNNLKHIRENDIVIFGWTTESRFRIANNVNEFIDIIPFNAHPKQNDDVDKKTTEQIGYNKIMYNIWWKEIINFIDVISRLLIKNKYVRHWTWVDNKETYPEKIWSEEMIKMTHFIDFTNWESASEELKNIVKSNSDVIYDFMLDVDYDQFRQNLNLGKKIVVINVEHCKGENLDFISNKEFKRKYMHSINYKKECFKLFIPYKNYNRISEETKGAVDDPHISKEGHKVLAKDLMNSIIIEKNKLKSKFKII